MHIINSQNVEQQILSNLARQFSLSVFVVDPLQHIVYEMQSRDPAFTFAPVQQKDQKLFVADISLETKIRQVFTAFTAIHGEQEKGTKVWQKQVHFVDKKHQTWRITIAPALGFRYAQSHTEQHYFLITLKQQETSARELHEILKKIWGLSPREADITCRLVKRQPLKTIADECCVSYQTARWYLREIFRKTGVNRQQDLITLVLSYA